MNLPYTIVLAKEWLAEDRGLYVNYTPSIAPVGMDIYMFGHYSAAENESQLFNQVRDEWALKFIRPIKKDISLKDMETVLVNDVEALYCQTTGPRPEVVWRQWVFVKSGYAFAIVSAIDKKNEKKLLPEVKSMVDSFKAL